MKVSDAPPPAKGQPNDQPQAGGTVALSPEQFARIEELLLPGYELAKRYLEEEAKRNAAYEKHQAEQANPAPQPAPVSPAETPPAGE